MQPKHFGIALVDSFLVAVLETLTLDWLGFYRSSRIDDAFFLFVHTGIPVFVGIFCQYLLLSLLPGRICVRAAWRPLQKVTWAGMMLGVCSGAWAGLYRLVLDGVNDPSIFAGVFFYILGGIILGTIFCGLSLTFLPLGFLLFSTRRVIGRPLHPTRTVNRSSPRITKPPL